MESESPSDLTLAERLDRIFGRATDPMQLLEERARELLPEYKVIVWEADAATFQSRFISRSAEDLLGHPLERWTTEPNFWPEKVIHDEDRETALMNCALAIARRSTCDFTSRALAADGRVVPLRDIIRVVIGPRRIATKLRGLMIELPESQKVDREIKA